MIRTGIFYFAGLLLVIASCQPDTKKQVKQNEKMIVRYFVQYLQNDRVFRSEARFYNGADEHKASLMKMNTVSFQGGSMELTSAPKEPFVYKTERRGPFQTDLKFRYALNEQEVSTDLHLAPVESFLVKGPISQSKGFTLVWDGLPLAKGEELLLFFADQSNKAASSTLRGPTPRSEVQLGGTFLEELQRGKGKLFLVREKNGIITEGSNTYEFELAFYTRPIEIDILP